MAETIKRTSLWQITTPEAIAWSVSGVYQDPETELNLRIERARNEDDHEAILMFEAVKRILVTTGPPSSLMSAIPPAIRRIFRQPTSGRRRSIGIIRLFTAPL